jgi:hypothetical protein
MINEDAPHVCMYAWRDDEKMLMSTYVRHGGMHIHGTQHIYTTQDPRARDTQVSGVGSSFHCSATYYKYLQVSKSGSRRHQDENQASEGAARGRGGRVQVEAAVRDG